MAISQMNDWRRSAITGITIRNSSFWFLSLFGIVAKNAASGAQNSGPNGECPVRVELERQQQHRFQSNCRGEAIIRSPFLGVILTLTRCREQSARSEVSELVSVSDRYQLWAGKAGLHPDGNLAVTTGNGRYRAHFPEFA